MTNANYTLQSRLCVSDFKTSESGKPARGVQAQTKTALGVRVLRTHSTPRTRKASIWLSRSIYQTNYLADVTGRRVLSPTQLHTQRYKTGKHITHCPGSGETLRLRIRQINESVLTLISFFLTLISFSAVKIKRFFPNSQSKHNNKL